jgi:HYR domain
MKTQNVHVSKSTTFEFLLQILARAAANRSGRSPFVPPEYFQRPRCEMRLHASPPESSSRSAPPPTAFNGRFASLIAILALLILAVMPAHAHWPNTNATKFVQFPDTSSNGMDIHLKNFPTILADDFICTNTGPITDIHLWLSSLQNIPTTGAQFELSIWSDVEANPLTGQLSHPGVKLWSETFNPGDYSIVVAYTNLNETFWDLDPITLMGPDNTLFLYNFYPRQPYTQTGNPTNHVVYWLGVTMMGNEPFQGWKTSTNHLGPDFAVLGHYAGATVTDWRTLFDPRVPAVGLDFSFALTTRPNNPTNPPPPCVDTNTVKYVQDPQIDGGWDVWDSGPWALADDFICTNTGPITDIHIWGSWLNDLEEPNTTFWLAIYDDVPAVTNGPVLIPSRPGTNILWQQYFLPGQYAKTIVGPGIEQFMDPGPPAVMGPDTQVYYYCFYPSNPPTQTGNATNARVYWLAVYALPAQGTANLFGWKTSYPQRHDISTHTLWPGSAPLTTSWTPTRDPGGLPLDLAFKITTATNEPECCPEGNGVKYRQRPDVSNGPHTMDVNASLPLVIADDFPCTNTGPITDIHIWGSWLFDVIDPNAVFTLGIWADVPAQPNAPSHPGVRVWSQTFGPGQYTICPYTNVNAEPFYDASLPANLGVDTKVYYLCFYPTNPFVQQGTATRSTNYWLSVSVQTTAGSGTAFGWHSSFDFYNDIAVWGNAPLPPIWTPMHELTGAPISLAFKVNTDTNDCPLTVNCPTNKTVPCGSSWTFDLPTASSPCCTNISITVFSTVTNGICPQLITQTWVITDCLGHVANCSQTVTVVDTTPPVLACSTNKTVECGSVWDFDKPLATDDCCTNVSVLAWNTITNGNCPKLVTRTWLAIDCCSNTAACTQTVTVVDTTPPMITCPSNIVVTTCVTNPIVFWTIIASDNCSTNVTIVSSPPSGSAFPWGTNTVHVTATDECGNTNTCSFLVIVQRPVLTLTITPGPGTITITWSDGTLQSATNLLGPYTDVPLATSPYTTAVSLPMKFYRLRCP